MFFKKSKSIPRLSPEDFKTQIFEMFVKFFTQKGYLDNNTPSVPEVINWVSTVPLRVLKNRSIATLSAGNAERFYIYAGSLSFTYASYLVYMWDEHFEEFSRTNYQISGLEEEFETALNDMDLNIVKKNGELVTAQEIVDSLIQLLSILNHNIKLFGNISNDLYKDYIYAGMQAFFLLGMSVKLNSIGYK